jgi:hypothetical protein
MNVLSLLIKKNKSQIQLLLRDLTIFQSNYDILESEKKQLYESIHEQSYAHREYAYLAFVDTFIRASKNRVTAIELEQKTLESRITFLSKEIFELFSENKKYDEVVKQRKNKELQKQAKKQLDILDEYVLNQTQRD